MDPSQPHQCLTGPPPSVGMLKQEQWLGNEDSRVLGEDFIYDRIIITVSS